MSLFEETATVRQRLVPGPGAVELVLAAPKMAQAIRPGQFVMVRSEAAGAPYLGRPMSYFQRSPSGISILFRIVGAGTRHLAGLVPGAVLRLLGPLGQPYADPPPGEVWLVGGGVGVAPLYDWALMLRQGGQRVVAVVGARTKDQLLGDAAFLQAADRCLVTTDDGTAGQRAQVVDVLSDRAQSVYACGPLGMLQAVKRWAEGRRAPTYLTLEARMACGFGACLGCTVAAAHPDARLGAYGHYLRVCHEGPTFLAEEVSL